ncbi:SDR family oxidoreductase [Mesorhizobium sp. LHD-90]|uniref:SDR family oxidoreductase n=1 Tax=Mesorhizobium sp. LHD-90 TaxID=3071414 RepID=UPI0027E0AAF2|nr:SDR family oxidoreductase [Mesorhizobium sp. LHD-90]MDQ6433552.1 SDR family oxidoreductase [Mesorhizobium sp. LHD-90]
MRVLILGGSGLIGTAVVTALAGRGHALIALARDIAAASRRIGHVEWLSVDLATLSQPTDWQKHLDGIDCVVNCAGALQDGGRDDLAALQTATLALYTAAARPKPRLIVQVSARTEGASNTTRFIRTKRHADTALKECGLPFVILRPAIVIGRNAYGGSALLRALAAFPIVSPLANADTPMQFVALDDVGTAVVDAVEGRIPPDGDLDLAAPQTLTLAQAVALHRRWLGLPPAATIAVPFFAARLLSQIADGLGHLGWRSPLRSTAMTVASGGVADHVPPSGRSFKPLAEILATPAGAQDLWFARLYLLKAPVFASLSLFWLLSGLIALFRFDASAQHLISAGASTAAAGALTLATSLADIVLGIGVAIRRYAAAALKGMLLLSAIYLLSATVLTPGLWTDPLGPLVKVLPSLALTLVALAILDER